MVNLRAALKQFDNPILIVQSALYPAQGGMLNRGVILPIEGDYGLPFIE
ncbi:hypothetical protein C943_04603 [Mariniradius saccharolyticus AK6]|uniref:Uncharacterized protein n=1 Tax=Mariniradius saccharolyticus AK6 TaxID=1239962 RepID=M7XFT3_9BACT|nr:hypothetical protein C943_04603 [Mariniradius saccharolyticus AK6]